MVELLQGYIIRDATGCAGQGNTQWEPLLCIAAVATWTIVLSQLFLFLQCCVDEPACL